MVTYDHILKPQKLAQGMAASSKAWKSQQDHVSNLSLKSEDVSRHTIHRDQMIFGSVSQRDHEAAK